jgi:hypothetical protein
MEEALKPILELRKYRLFYNGAIREFYSFLSQKHWKIGHPHQQSDGAKDHGQDAFL